MAVGIVILIGIVLTLASIALLVYCIFYGLLKIPWQNLLHTDQDPELDILIESDARNN